MCRSLNRYSFTCLQSKTLGREMAIRNMKQNIEKSKQRIKELEEQKELLATVEHDEQAVRKGAEIHLNKGKRCNPHGLHRILHKTVL